MTHSWMNSLHPGYIISPDICPPSCVLGHCLPVSWGVENGIPRPSQQENVRGSQSSSHGLFKHTQRITSSFWVCAHALVVPPDEMSGFWVRSSRSFLQSAREVTTWAVFLAFLPWVLVTSLIFRFLKNKENKTNHSRTSRPQHLAATCNLGCLRKKKCFDHFSKLDFKNVWLGVFYVKRPFFFFFFLNSGIFIFLTASADVG